MLSLKTEKGLLPSRTTNLSLLELPTEILTQIIDHVVSDSSNFTPSILPASLVCHALRTATLPILFQSLSISMGPGAFIDRRTFNLLAHLAKPEIHHAKHVRCLNQLPMISGTFDLNTSMYSLESKTFETIMSALKRLTGLRLVR